MNNLKKHKLVFLVSNLAAILVFLYLCLAIFEDSYSGLSYLIYSLAISIMWIALGGIYANKTLKNLNLIIFSLYAFFLYSYCVSLEPILSKDSLFIITILFLLMSSLSAILISINRKLTTHLVVISLCFILLISALLTVIYTSAGSISQDSIYAILQSNQGEAIAFFLANSLLYDGVLFSLLVFILLLYVGICKSKISHVDVDLKLKVKLFSLLLSLSIVTAYSNASLMGIEKIFDHYNAYHFEIALAKQRAELAKQHNKRLIFQAKTEISEKRKASLIPSNKVEQKSATGELHVLIIGESLAKFNLSSYGYLNQTTPWLDTSAVQIQFSNVYSSHTHTMQALSMSLTSSNQYNGKKYYTSPSLISELNLAGYQTAWISNQVQAGEWDNQVSVIADESDYVNFINANIGKITTTNQLDSALYDELEIYLATINSQENNFIVLHMMGSHEDYCSRTKGIDINLEKLARQFYANKDNLCYDKSVRYADAQLKKIYGLLDKQKSFSSMLFMPDHGEDVFNQLGHNSSKFTEYMAQIPMIFWPGNNIANTIVDNLRNNADKLFTNDLLFDTVLGITHVNSSSKEDIYNLASEHYANLEGKATTLHGKINISDLPTNVSKHNVARNNHFMAHRVNTLGALNDAYKQGFSRIEFDLYYDEQSNTILMGHGREALTGGTLAQFLRFENGKFTKLWLDFKNINATNINKINERLDALDISFNLKSRAMIESGMTSHEFSSLSVQGWYTSYYLPTRKILELIKENNEIKSNNYALELLKQVNKQEVAAISFDHRLYPYVKDYLLKNALLPKHIKLNSWLWLLSSDSNFDNKINNANNANNAIINSPYIDNIIIQFPTRFKM